MPKIAYREKRFRTDALRVIDQANSIIGEYVAAGYRLTLRQIYYQFVSRDLIPNTVAEYKRLGGIVSDGRLAGLIDWDAIEDRTRNLKSLPHWKDEPDVVDACARQFRLDLWADQDNRVEVWIEKEALAGVFERVCNDLRVPFFCCRGYTSQSEMWSAAQRFHRYHRQDQAPVVLHFGDHDPSGIDMSRDIEDRLEEFGGCPVFERLALNFDQVEHYKPPPNPAKETDSRFEGYREKYGDESWELDALEPQVLARLVSDHVQEWIDIPKWEAAKAKEADAKKNLALVTRSWDDVMTWLKEK